jgi:hypothetical protein
MTSYIWKPGLALGAVLAFCSVGSAADRDTITLGGTGSIAQAASEDLEMTHGYRYRGGYYGWGGGYGYRSYYRPAYYGSFYRPAFYYTPRVYYPTFYYPRPVYYGYYRPTVGFYIGISGNASTTAPTVNLGTNFSQPLAEPQPLDGTFPYDGGPANPVPLPKPDAQPIPPANTGTDLRVFGTSKSVVKPTTTPLKYKAFGEK